MGGYGTSRQSAWQRLSDHSGSRPGLTGERLTDPGLFMCGW
jgi:hypothetical protein